VIVHTMEQRSPEWYAARDRCLVTASDMGPWMFKTDATSAKARNKRINEYLAGLVEKDEWQIKLEEDERRKLQYNVDLQRGNALEGAAREAYEDLTGKTLAQVGLITTNDGLFGASADSFHFLDNGAEIPGCYGHGLEIKVPRRSTLIGYVRDGVLPDEYRGQVHGSMIIAERDEWDFFACYPLEGVALKDNPMPYLHLTVKRDSFTRDLEQGMNLMRKQLAEEKAKLAEVRERQGRAVA